MTVWRNQADILRERLSVMLRNGASGFLLVCAVLAVFLDLRLAWWVSLGIPILADSQYVLQRAFGR